MTRNTRKKNTNSKKGKWKKINKSLSYGKIKVLSENYLERFENATNYADFLKFYKIWLEFTDNITNDRIMKLKQDI